jgi:phage terminase large subunit GpA-like protein
MKTTLLVCVALYNAYVTEQHVLIVLHNENTSKEVLENLKLMILASPALKPLYPTKRGNANVHGIRLRNGVKIKIATGNSAGALRSFSAGCVIVDELDGLKESFEGEGSPINLAEARTLSYGDSGNVWLASTPTDDNGHITEAYKKALSHEWRMSCPGCAAELPLSMDDLKWEKVTDRELEKSPDLIRWECPRCQHKLNEKEFRKVREEGRFVEDGDNEFKSERILGYTISGLISQKVNWLELVFKKREAANDRKARQAFDNTYLGIPYNLAKQKVTNHTLRELIDPKLKVGQCPDHTLAIHAGIDCGREGEEGDYHHHVVTIAALPGDRYCVLKYVRVVGEADLMTELQTVYTTPDGRQVAISYGFIDSGFAAQTYIYDLADRFGLIPVKGHCESGWEILRWSPPSKMRSGPLGLIHKQRNLAMFFDYVKFKQITFVSGLDSVLFQHLSAWEYDQDTKKYMETKRDVEDHGLDSTRYCLVSFQVPQAGVRGVQTWEQWLQMYPELNPDWQPPETPKQTNGRNTDGLIPEHLRPHY